ncbi:DUF2059 domain-containing protein [Acinetobacter sp. WZC-1]|uniref:DUF2059 domain-containing protein n=1 Tax=Acinetobacter sp. WZC-1 TaxID=3459034 RepID=UPI00403E2C7D
MKITSWILACSLNGLSCIAMAAPPSDQAIEKLMQVMNMNQLLQETMQQIRPQMDQQAYAIVQNIVKHEQLTPQEQVIANQLANKLFEQSKQAVSWQQMQPVWQKIYKQAYTAEEVQAQIDFYSSAIGQSILKKTPLVAQESMKIMNTRMAATMQSAEKDFQEINKQLAELKKKAGENK